MKSAEDWNKPVEVGNASWFREMSKYAKPDAHLYEVCYVLEKMLRWSVIFGAVLIVAAWIGG